jgi:hypothetical protein
VHDNNNIEYYSVLKAYNEKKNKKFHDPFTLDSYDRKTTKRIYIIGKRQASPTNFLSQNNLYGRYSIVLTFYNVICRSSTHLFHHIFKTCNSSVIH